MRGVGLAGVLLILLAPLIAAAQTGAAKTGAAQTAVPEPDGYHAEPYQSPVPATLRGATVLDGPGALAAAKAGALMIDVLPEKKRPQGLPPGTLWREQGHDTIAGAIWLPDTGYADLSEADDSLFARSLAALTAGDTTRPLVFFCKPDCWMSWNAAKRAIAKGYSAVAWLPGGVAAWQQAGGAVEPARPWGLPL